MSDRVPSADLPGVLMVSYTYMPMETPGTRRTAAFARYLPRYGYRAVVLSTSSRGRLNSKGAARIYRTPDPLVALERAYRAVSLRHVNPSDRARAVMSPRSKAKALPAALTIPDPKIGWLPLAVIMGHRVISSGGVSLVYSTSPPETNHLVALLLKRQLGLPWVADFRDGWMFEPLQPGRLELPWRRQLEGWLEGRVVGEADALVVVNQTMADDFQSRYPGCAAKLRVIPNGFDPEEVAALERCEAGRHDMRLVYTGRLSGSRRDTSIEGLLRAMEELRSAETSELQDLTVVLVGGLTADELRSIDRSPVRDRFEVLGEVPHRDALQYQVDADALLLVVASGSRAVSTSKIYEYLSAGRPILALSGESPAADLVTGLRAGVVVHPCDVPGIKGALSSLHAQWRAGSLKCGPWKGAEQFDRRELTGCLAAVFDHLTNRSEEGVTLWARALGR